MLFKRKCFDLYNGIRKCLSARFSSSKDAYETSYGLNSIETIAN